MGKIYNSITELIGKTPLLRLNKFEEKKQSRCEYLCKARVF